VSGAGVGRRGAGGGGGGEPIPAFQSGAFLLESGVRIASGNSCGIRRHFAAAFSRWRRQRKIPLKQVAVELGFSVATISKWEHGRCFPSGQSLEQIARYTGQPLCHLLCEFAPRCHRDGCLRGR
jgi:Helix-turn-helix domain